MKSNILRFLTVLAFLTSVCAMTAGQVWLQRFNGPGNGSDGPIEMVIDSNNNVFVAGDCAMVTNVPYLSLDYVVIKSSSAGVPLWTNFYNGTGNGNDQASDMTIDASGNVIVTGKSRGTGSVNDFATIKYSNAGVPLWTNRFRYLSASSDATGVDVDTNGNVFVIGYASGWQVLKYSSAGVPLWTNRYTFAQSGQPYPGDLVVDVSGNLVVTGSEVGATGGDNWVTIKYSTAGLPLWTNRFNGPANGSDTASDVAADKNGNIFVTGSMINSSGAGEFATIKYSSGGIPLWTNYYKGTGSFEWDGAYAVVVNTNGDAFVTGPSEGSTGYSDYVTIKYSGAGVPLWTNRYNTTYGSTPTAMVLDAVGNVFVTGELTDPNYLAFNYHTVGYSSSGAQVFLNQYGGPANRDDTGTALGVDVSGNIYVTGWSTPTNGYADIATVKYTGVQPPPMKIQKAGNGTVLSWDNSTFILQAAPSIGGSFTNIPGAITPYTNTPSGPSRFFRLKYN